MAQQIKALYTKLNNLISIPGIHMVEGKTDTSKLSSDFQMHSVVST